TKPPVDVTKLTTTQSAVEKAYAMSGLGPDDVGVLEVHDCFSITGLLMLEACGFAGYGEGAAMVDDGKTNFGSDLPVNSSGGLIGFGHYTGGTGVRQCVDIIHQLTGKAGDCQAELKPSKPYGLMTSMGGNDKTVVAAIFSPVAD
ncbi:MAG: 3-ketoacyl-CoA thiolase, partial [candidate division KSB1 bacterium]|nr:3-ketoacyl-CoA thiolase [candidate division KSB1 bacterium]